MPEAKAIRGRNSELVLMYQATAGGALTPLARFPVNDFSIEQRTTVDEHNYIGEQGDRPDIEVKGYGGSLTIEVVNKEVLRLENAIVAQQYENTPVLDVRFSARLKMPGSEEVMEYTFGECVLEFKHKAPSRSGFYTITVNWRSGGRPTVLDA